MCIVVNTCEIENMLPFFGSIKQIFITDVNQPFTICSLHSTNYFDEHYPVFNVTYTSKLVCISLATLNQKSHEVHVPGSNLIFIPYIKLSYNCNLLFNIYYLVDILKMLYDLFCNKFVV